MPELFNFETNAVEDVPEEHVGAAVASGSFGLPKGGSVNVISPSGERGTVPAEEAQKAFQDGFRFETTAERVEAEKEKQYGDTGAAARAALEGAARGSTFGLSDLVLTKLGADAEGMKERKERNPVAAIGGELASAALLNPLGSLGIAGKVAGRAGKAIDLLAKGAGAAPKALSGAAGLLERGIVKAAGEGLLARATAKAASMALEAEAFNIAHNLSEAALGEKDITAERLLANSGSALALGAGIGFAMPIAGKVAGAAATKAKESLDKASALLREKILPAAGKAAVEPVAGVSAALSGTNKGELVSMLDAPFTPAGAEMRKKLLEGVTPESREAVAREFTDSVKASFDETRAAMKASFKEARPQEIEKLLADVPIDGAAKKATQMLDGAKGMLAEMRAQPDVFTQKGLISKLEQAVTGFEKQVALGGDKITTAELFNLTDDFKRTLDKQVGKWGKNISPEAMDSVDMARNVRGLVKGFLEDGEAFGEAAVRQQAFNSAAAAHFEAEKEFLRLFGEKTGTTRSLSPTKIDTFLRQVGIAKGTAKESALQRWLETSKNLTEQMAKSHELAGLKTFDKAGLESLLEKSLKARGVADEQLAALNRLNQVAPTRTIVGMPGITGIAQSMAQTLSSPSALVKTLSTAEGIALNTTKRISSAVDAFMSGAKKAAKGLPSPRPVIAPLSVNALGGRSFGTATDERGRKKNENKVAAFKRQFAELSKQVADPTGSAMKLDDGFTGMGDHAPQLRAALVAKQLTAAQFLHDKAPKDPNEGLSLNPLIDDWQPSDAELAKWERYAAAVADPLSVVEEMQQGMITPEGVEALRTVYPAVYTEVQQAFATRIGELRQQLPYKERLNLSTLMDLPVDPSTTPQFVAAMQAAHGQAIQEEQQQQEMRLRPSANVNPSVAFETPLQRVANR